MSWFSKWFFNLDNDDVKLVHAWKESDIKSLKVVGRGTVTVDPKEIRSKYALSKGHSLK